MFETDMDNMRTEAISSGVTGEKTVYSHAVTIFGIPIIYIAIAVLLILVILYLACWVKRKDSHHFNFMKKSSYIELFIACVVIMSLINFHYSAWEIAPDFSFIIIVILFSLVESLIPYFIIILSIHIINCYLQSS
jgi:hypothetical protein